ncbi:MAG: hypothetical protein QOF01_3255 [Thermomicrobiales bacterium]|jgi:hypothetical protein|nr:hypothetical protein [Thermomicrobiales bacterium]
MIKSRVVPGSVAGLYRLDHGMMRDGLTAQPATRYHVPYPTGRVVRSTPAADLNRSGER